MLQNLAKTYEVYSEMDGKWVYEGTHKAKSKAMHQAETLLGSGKVEGAKVVAENSKGAEEVIFEQSGGKVQKAISVVPIEVSPVCHKVNELYGFEARQTGGKLLRKYLDDIGMTAAELMFDAGYLRVFERNDMLFNGAMGRLGGIQARITGEKPVDRTETIYKLFAELKDKAQAAIDFDDIRELVQDKGPDALIAHVEKTIGNKSEHPYFILAGLTAYLGEFADWNAKAEGLISVLNSGVSDTARTYLDDLLAEVLDGALAVQEILGGVADLAQAQKVMIGLATGRLEEVKNPISCINELNAAIGQYGLPRTRQVILDRAAAGFRSIKPLTRVGKQGDRDAFVKLCRDLVGPCGFYGGSEMAEAITLRARMALGGDNCDLTGDQAIAQLMGFLPLVAGRFGYLLDLAPGKLGQKHHQTVVRALAHSVKHADSREKLAGDASMKVRMEILASLSSRIASSELPDDVLHAITGAIECLRDDSDDAAHRDASKEVMDQAAIDQAAMATPASQEPDATASSKPKPPAGADGDKRQLVRGEVLFEEGEQGAEAYLVLSGEIEVYRRHPVEKSFGRLGRGELFGELSLIDDQPRMASARALKETELLIISKDSLCTRMSKLEQTDKVLWRLMEVMATRLRGLAGSSN